VEGDTNLITAVQALANNLKALAALELRRERVVIMLDNSNFFGSVTRICRDTSRKFRVDYGKLLTMLVEGRTVIDAFCYYSDWEVDEETRVRREGFQIMMEKTGFTLVTVQQRSRAIREKGVDAAIVRDITAIAREMPRCDTIILIAGDGDYSETVSEIRKRHGVKVEVAFFGVETAQTLKMAATRFTDLETMREQFEV
jgi:uncharacterized LabA/DUF88 family protein